MIYLFHFTFFLFFTIFELLCYKLKLIILDILGRIDAGQSLWLAEYRRVSVLFVNLKGLTFQQNAGEGDAEQSGRPDFKQLNEVLQVFYFIQ